MQSWLPQSPACRQASSCVRRASAVAAMLQLLLSTCSDRGAAMLDSCSVLAAHRACTAAAAGTREAGQCSGAVKGQHGHCSRAVKGQCAKPHLLPFCCSDRGAALLDSCSVLAAHRACSAAAGRSMRRLWNSLCRKCSNVKVSRVAAVAKVIALQQQLELRVCSALQTCGLQDSE